MNAVAGIFFDLPYMYFQTSFRLKVWFKEMADWRSSFQNWTTLLPLLVSQNEKKKDIYYLFWCIVQPCTKIFNVRFRKRWCSFWLNWSKTSRQILVLVPIHFHWKFALWHLVYVLAFIKIPKGFYWVHCRLLIRIVKVLFMLIEGICC